MNVPIPGKNYDEARRAVDKVLKTLYPLQTAHRCFFIVLGFNGKNEWRRDDLLLLERNVELIKRDITWNECQIDFVCYLWDACKNSSEVNYSDIRNRLFNHTATAAAMDPAFEFAKRVKLLCLDPDTTFSDSQLSELEAHWQSKSSAIITSGFYQYIMDSNETKLFYRNTVHWNGFLSAIENEIDCHAKQEFAKRSFSTTVGYKRLKAHRNKSDFYEVVAQNLLIFQPSALPGHGVRSHFTGNNFIKLADLYKELKPLLDQRSPRADKEVERLIYEIMAIEDKRLKTVPSSLSFTYSIPGDTILYPSENALFVDMGVLRKHVNVSTFPLWGKEGRAEGGAMAHAITQLVKGSKESSSSRRAIVDYPWTFSTALSDRSFCTSVNILNELPKFRDQLESLCDYDRVEGWSIRPESKKWMAPLIQGALHGRSQSVLNVHFPEQRNNVIWSRGLFPEQVCYDFGGGKPEGTVLKALHTLQRDSMNEAIETVFSRINDELNDPGRIELLRNVLQTRFTEAVFCLISEMLT